MQLVATILKPTPADDDDRVLQGASPLSRSYRGSVHVLRSIRALARRATPSARRAPCEAAQPAAPCRPREGPHRGPSARRGLVTRVRPAPWPDLRRVVAEGRAVRDEQLCVRRDPCVGLRAREGRSRRTVGGSWPDRPRALRTILSRKLVDSPIKRGSRGPTSSAEGLHGRARATRPQPARNTTTRVHRGQASERRFVDLIPSPAAAVVTADAAHRRPLLTVSSALPAARRSTIALSMGVFCSAVTAPSERVRTKVEWALTVAECRCASRTTANGLSAVLVSRGLCVCEFSRAATSH